MDRTILHVDANNFYASCELVYHPELRGKPLVVGGDESLRHGIVLAKSYEAKKFGIATGNALIAARQKCPDLIVLPPRFDLYLRFSQKLRTIFADYTDKMEPFGLDEAWLDISRCPKSDGVKVANEIRSRTKRELGLTVSVGVSWNKIFAKLGSDMRKPDATTVISRENYRALIWPLPVADLLYVGPATASKLNSHCVRTIGDLAATPDSVLKTWFGINGLMIRQFSLGNEQSEVSPKSPPIDSIGNSNTAPHDLCTEQEVRVYAYLLSESVASRLKDHGFMAHGIQIYIRDNKLEGMERQTQLRRPSQLSKELAEAALDLFTRNYDFRMHPPVRSLGVRAIKLTYADGVQQMSFLEEDAQRDKIRDMEAAVDKIRARYGYHSIKRGMMLVDRRLSALDAKSDNIIHPVGFLGGRG